MTKDKDVLLKIRDLKIEGFSDENWIEIVHGVDLTKLFIEFNGIYEAFFGDHKPARAVVAVKALPKAGRIEIKCTAYHPAT